jgi:hypothetical protein
MIILMLSREDSLCKEGWGYARAFERRGDKLVCIEPDTPLNVDIETLLKKCPTRPDLILHPETDYPYLPEGLNDVDIPTAYFHIDTYKFLPERLRASSFFDIPILFHPQFEEQFRNAGHAGALTLLHAAQIDFYGLEPVPQTDRSYEVGWVGRVGGDLYQTRQRVLPVLAREFRMNDWKRRYTLLETADQYRQSKIVVNVGRDDYPGDANMRVFEVMAAGTLLMTLLPSELTLAGFVEGEHFVGYRDERDIVPLIRQFLKNDVARQRIANAGRELVLHEHTYDHRVTKLANAVSRLGVHLPALSRRWPETRTRLVRLEYFSADCRLDCAYREFRWLAKHSLGKTLRAVPVLGRALVRHSRNRRKNLQASVARS